MPTNPTTCPDRSPTAWNASSSTCHHGCSGNSNKRADAAAFRSTNSSSQGSTSWPRRDPRSSSRWPRCGHCAPARSWHDSGTNQHHGRRAAARQRPPGPRHRQRCRTHRRSIGGHSSHAIGQQRSTLRTRPRTPNIHSTNPMSGATWSRSVHDDHPRLGERGRTRARRRPGATAHRCQPRLGRVGLGRPARRASRSAQRLTNAGDLCHARCGHRLSVIPRVTSGLGRGACGGSSTLHDEVGSGRGHQIDS